MTEAIEYLEDPYREEADEAIAGLEELIRFFDQNPKAAMKFSPTTMYAFTYSEEEWREFNTLLGAFDKKSTSYDLEATRKFGKLTLKHCISHDKVCEKKIVGTRTVIHKEPTTVVEYEDVETEEDIVEWICPEAWR